MSAEEFDAGLELRAYVEGRAISCSSHRRVAIHEGATLVALRTMAGVEGSLWGVAVGRAGDARPVVVVAADPVVGAEQAECFRAIGAEASCEPHPCLVVANSDAAEVLAAAALRARRSLDPVVARGVEIARFATERFEVAGNDSLVVATTALGEHFVWPGRELEPGNLVRALSCIAGRPVGVDRRNDGSTTTPLELDLARLTSVVSRSRRERERSGEVSTDNAKRRRVEVASVLAPLLRADFALLAEAVRVLGLTSLDLLPGAPRRCATEARAWARAESRMGRGVRRASRPGALLAALHLAECERARTHLESELVTKDRVARARAVASGSILAGEVAAVEGSMLEVVTTQATLRMRAGDRVVLHGLGVSAEVVELEARALSTSVRLRLAGPLPGEVTVGSSLETTLEVLDIPTRPKDTAWTHARPAAARADAGSAVAG